LAEVVFRLQGSLRPKNPDDEGTTVLLRSDNGGGASPIITFSDMDIGTGMGTGTGGAGKPRVMPRVVC